MNNCIIFAPIAEREATFYLKIAQEIQKNRDDIHICFISFYQPCNITLREHSFEVYDIYDALHETHTERDVHSIEKIFKIENIHKMIIHEKLTFGINNSYKLEQKFCNYLLELDKYLQRVISSHSNVKIYQELGGFIAPLSLYFASQKNNIEHFFFEPSFFKGRIHFVKNSLSPVLIEETAINKIYPQVLEYLNHIKANKTIVAPLKDQHHFKDMGLSKIINRPNIIKMINKLKYKYVYGLQQEYEHISNHVLRYAKMYINRKLISKLYTNFESVENQCFVYFPFHVQLDYSLTIRSLEYLDQLSLVEYIARILPSGVLLLLKEHPASIGGFSYGRLKALLQQNDNVKLIHPQENSYNIINNAELIITINSKAGAEALISNKEVIALGTAFYSRFSNVHFVQNLQELNTVLHEILIIGMRKNNPAQNYLFNDIWNKSHPVELYKNDPNNIALIADVILQAKEVSCINY